MTVNLLNINLDFQTILLVIGIVMNTILGILIFVHQRKEFVNRIYIFNIFCIVWWSVMMVFYRLSPVNTMIYTIGLYVAPTFIASSFLYFVFFFPEEMEKLKFKKIYLLYITVLNLLVVAATLVPGLIIKGVDRIQGQENVIHFGSLYVIYTLYISGFFGIGLFILARKLFLINDRQKKWQLSYLLGGYLIASSLAMVTNLTLPYLGYFQLNWLGQVLTVFMVIPVTYAIFKHHLFDVKVIATELITILLWLFLLARLLLDPSSRERIIDGVLLFAVLIIGSLLIKSVSREVEQREKIELLAKELESANSRLKELDRMKDEFLSIASHQLRAPITAVRGYASLILDGDYGTAPEPMKEPLQRIAESSRNMANSIEDYLNISRIEQGRMKFEKSEFDLTDLAGKVVDELRPVAERKGLKISLVKSDALKVSADIGKVKQVITNLADNAIKYTTEGGIEVSVATVSGKARLMVKDTGMGIPQDEIGKLFEKFIRARDANKVNTTGTGLGLYVAKQLVEGNGGKVWAESDGAGKGSRFIFELPL